MFGLNNYSLFIGLPEKSLEPEEFQKKFTRFLFGSVGSKHRLLLGFEDDIICGEPAPKLTVCKVPDKHEFEL